MMNKKNQFRNRMRLHFHFIGKFQKCDVQVLEKHLHLKIFVFQDIEFATENSALQNSHGKGFEYFL